MRMTASGRTARAQPQPGGRSESSSSVPLSSSSADGDEGCGPAVRGCLHAKPLALNTGIRRRGSGGCEAWRGLLGQGRDRSEADV